MKELPETTDLTRIVAVDEFEPLAHDRLPTAIYDYIAGSAGSGATSRGNIEAFSRYVFRPRVMIDVSSTETSTSVLGTRIAAPIIFAPTALQRLVHPEGELATARAVKRLELLMCVSTSASTRIEEIATVTRHFWFQLYWLSDQGATRDLVERAVANGARALVLSVDSAVPFWRDNEMRAPLRVPSGMRRANISTESPDIAPDLTWKALEWLRSIANIPIALKGILTATDTALAAQHGVDAVIVSNHGGRALDWTIPTLEALPEVVEAANGALETYVDGGVRRGTDVLKALALGARAVLLGRPALWALAVGGEDGIVRLIDLIRGELLSAMGLCGCRTVAEINPSLVRLRR